MRSDKRILLAFLLNLGFSLFEFVGGILTGSVAILSDALHDLGDAAGIGVSLILERKSKRKPDEAYTYGYARYSVLGSVFTTLLLLAGSVAVIGNAVNRLFHPTAIHYDGMIVFAVVGVIINLAAAFLTHGGESLNQKAVSLHMLEDVLGWVVVLIGAVVMRFTDFWILDPIMSVAVALFIGIHAGRTLWEALPLFLEKAPRGIDTREIQACLSVIPGVVDVHHIHLWSMDERHNCATMHIVTNAPNRPVKEAVRHALSRMGISHATLELEAEGEICPVSNCSVANDSCNSHHCHHHHH